MTSQNIDTPPGTPVYIVRTYSARPAARGLLHVRFSNCWWLTNSMELSTNRETTNCVATWFYGTRRFITEFTRALHLSQSWAWPIQSTPPYPIFPRSVLILSTHLCFGLPNGLFSYTRFLFSPIRAPCPTHLIILDLITLIKSVSETIYHYYYYYYYYL
jgi:hypothetical protein